MKNVELEHFQKFRGHRVGKTAQVLDQLKPPLPNPFPVWAGRGDQRRVERAGARMPGGVLIALLLGFLVLLTGCATPPPALNASVPPTPPWPAPPPAGFATILMYTTRSAMGNGPAVYVDDVQAFKLHWHSYTWVYARAGDHIIRTKWGIGLGGLNATGHVNLAAGKNYYLKLTEWDDYYFESDKENVSAALRPVSEEFAMKETVHCDFEKPTVLQIDTVEQPASTPVKLPVSAPAPDVVPGPTAASVPIAQDLGAVFN